MLHCPLTRRQVFPADEIIVNSQEENGGLNTFETFDSHAALMATASQFIASNLAVCLLESFEVAAARTSDKAELCSLNLARADPHSHTPTLAPVLVNNRHLQ